MIKNLKKRRKKRLILLVLVILLVVVIACTCYYTKNKEVKSEYEIALEKELKEVTKIANKAWSKAYSTGKKEESEIREYIETSLKNEEIDPNKYYITITIKGVEIAKKHEGLLVEAGYYKAGTNYRTQIKKWNTLVNTRGVNAVEGRLGALRNIEGEGKVDIVLDESVTEIKDKVVAEDLKIGTLVIPESVEKMSTIALDKANIEEIVLNTNITNLEGHFKDLTSLNKITFTGAVRVIRGKTFNNTNIKEVNFIGNIEQLVNIKYVTYFDVPSHDKKCILYINGIRADEIVIPNGVEEIKDFAFHNYINITKITVPSTVTFIGTSAFTGTSAKEVIYEGTKEMWDKIVKMEEWVFNEIDCTVYCTNGNIVYGGLE